MLTRAIDSYLDVRRAVGFALTVDAGLLRNFARFATDRSETHDRHRVGRPSAVSGPAGTAPRHGAPGCHPRAGRGPRA
jgi:hypothetical protein